MVRSPLQWTLCSRGSTQERFPSHFATGGVPTRALRPEVWLAFCELVFATRAERMDPGSTTRRATVHSLRSGLKIESPKTREGPHVIIFRSWLEKRGGGVATAMVQQQPEYGTCRSRPQRRTPPKKLRIRFAMHFARLSRLLVAQGLCSCIGDVVYFDRKTHKRIGLEITRVAITQASISGSGVLAGPDAVLSILRARERERRRCAGISATA